MLIDQHRIAIRVDDYEERRPRRALISLCHQRNALRFEIALQIAHISKVFEPARVAVPAGIERQRVLVEHPLKQADGVIAIFIDCL